MLQIIHYNEIRCQLEIFKSISVIWTNETVVFSMDTGGTGTGMGKIIQKQAKMERISQYSINETMKKSL